MNNQIILDMNNQSITVDLICYFSNNNKKYIFYSKNETVQDGLIKMYVSDEYTGLSSEISPDEWNNLKKVMQGIITGNTSGIEFLPYNVPVKFNAPKAIALNDSNINLIKISYKNGVGVSEPVLNKDILSQSFGGNTETVVTEPVQISPIPEVQNNFNMEATPVNLNPDVVTPSVESAVVESVVPTIEPIVPSEPIIPTIEPIGDINTNNNDEQVLNINSIKPSGIDSAFKVSNEPNIFDNPNPYQITEEEINNTELPEVNNVNNEVFVNHVSSDNVLLDKKIELNNRKIKLFEELASIYKEENELLKKEDSDNELEKTASNLFNSNGTLNENEVLN